MMIGISQQMPVSSVARGHDGGQTLPASTTQVDSASFASVTPNFDGAASLSDIARRYDVRNMSPREMSALSQALFQSGAISFQDHALLSFHPELGSGFMGAASQADTPKDFILHWEQQLKFHEEHGERSFVKNDRRILNILGNLDALSQAG